MASARLQLQPPHLQQRQASQAQWTHLQKKTRVRDDFPLERVGSSAAKVEEEIAISQELFPSQPVARQWRVAGFAAELAGWNSWPQVNVERGYLRCQPMFVKRPLAIIQNRVFQIPGSASPVVG